MRRAGRRARVLMWGLFVGAGAAALAPAGPGALIPLKMAIASADSVGNDVYVAVVVDFGNGSSMSTVSKCVPVASSADDADALSAAVGSGNVAYANSGLLCAIDNYPANGVQNCGESAGSGKYDYWSYWHGSTGSWVYADDGPAEQSVSSPADDVEGWMFELDEPDNPTAPAPALTPSYSQICNASTEVPPAASAPAPATTTSTNATSPPVGVTPTTAETSAGSAPAATTNTAESTKPKSSGATSTATTAPAPTSAKTTTTLPAGGSDGTDSASNHGSPDGHRSAAASAPSHGSPGGGSTDNLLTVILVGVVVAALGGFALVRWRRRPAEE